MLSILRCPRSNCTAPGRTYVNYLDRDEGQDRARAIYGAEKLHRLTALKQRYDPLNVFDASRLQLGRAGSLKLVRKTRPRFHFCYGGSQRGAFASVGLPDRVGDKGTRLLNGSVLR